MNSKLIETIVIVVIAVICVVTPLVIAFRSESKKQAFKA